MSTQTLTPMPNQQPIANQTTPPIAPIDPTLLVQHGESPTAIILAISVLITLSLGSLTQLVRVIVVATRKPSKHQ